jgi:hypothetical protein
MKIVTKIFTSAGELSNIKKELDLFLRSYCKNPFLLYPFIENYMRGFCQNCTPAILVSSVNEKIVGLAPLQLRKTLGFNKVTFLFPYEVSPDFVVTEEYREEVLSNFLSIIVKKLKSKLIFLDLPIESQNLAILKRIYIEHKLKLEEQFTDEMKHCTISIQGSLGEFEKSQSGHAKKEIRRISRNLDKRGKWKITPIDDLGNDQVAQETFDKMMAIEKMSWKENFRLQTGSTIDKDLLWIWGASLSTAKTNPDFKVKLWFLELNDQAIAYEYFIEYRGTAFFTKTSYAEKYRRIYPGVFICNALIIDQFRRQEMKKIDLLTNLPYMKRWKSICLSRVKIKLSKDALLNLLLDKLMALLNRFLSRINYRKI